MSILPLQWLNRPNMAESIFRYMFDLVVIDEAHQVKDIGRILELSRDSRQVWLVTKTPSVELMKTSGLPWPLASAT